MAENSDISLAPPPSGVGAVPFNEHANTPLRMYIALRVLRAWNHGTWGYCSSAVLAVNGWIDAGMRGPIPWPESAFFADWAEKHGYSKIDGRYIGFMLTAQMTPQQGPARLSDGNRASNTSEILKAT